MILPSARAVWLILWSSPSHFSLPHHGLSLLEDGMEFTIHLNYHQECLILRTIPIGARVKVDVLRRFPLPKIWTVPYPTGNMMFHFFGALTLHLHWAFGFRCVHLLQFFCVCDHYDSFPDSPRVKWITEKYTWQDLWAELMQSRLVFRRNKVIFDAPNGITGPL